MASAGYDVVLNDLVDDEKTKETLEGVRARGRSAEILLGDISNVEERVALVDRAYAVFGTIDCLVNNAGVQVDRRGDILDATPESFDRVMGVNLRGTFFLTQEFARRMIAERRPPGGPRRSIISISSASAYLVSPQLAEYCMSKTGLTMMTKMLAVRLAQHDIYVHEVRPGVTRSDMSGQIAEKYEKLFAETDIVPMKRWGEPAGIGKAVASLAMGSIPFSTGDAVNIDGGLHIHKFIP
jgi:NAD(P)-dependent dehydrogenase (short-subunit alcohol dehydrogenase family)